MGHAAQPVASAATTLPTLLAGTLAMTARLLPASSHAGLSRLDGRGLLFRRPSAWAARSLV